MTWPHERREAHLSPHRLLLDEIGLGFVNKEICEEKRWSSPMPMTIFEGKERDEDRYKRLEHTSDTLEPEIGKSI